MVTGLRERCAHPEERREVRKFRNGGRSQAPSFKRQCQDCGKKLDQRALDPLGLPDGVKPKDVNWGIRKEQAPLHRKKVNSMQRRRAQNRLPDEQRKRVLERDDYTCQGCGEDNPDVLEVHHTVYPEIPEDGSRDEDLQTACGPCNMAERNDRKAGGSGGRIGQ